MLVYLQLPESRLEAGELLLFRTPLVDRHQPELGEKELLRADGPSVACFLLTLCYGTSLPRGLLS
jgi:hypothetical protein